MATKTKDKDSSIKKKQAADAIAQTNIDREMMSRRNDRPVVPVARPAIVPRPIPRPTPAPGIIPRPMPTDANRDEMLNADLQRQMASQATPVGRKCGGSVKGYKSGGSVKSSASSRADGIAQRGKTRGKYC